MRSREQFVDEEGPMTRVEYEDGTVVLAADTGPGTDASVDVVDGTAIVVTDGEHYEFEVPAGGDPEAFIRNGVLTVEVKE